MHEHTTFVTCPHCDYEDHDGWELFRHGDERTETTCERCGKDFNVRQIVDVCYSSYKLEGAD